LFAKKRKLVDNPGRRRAFDRAFWVGGHAMKGEDVAQLHIDYGGAVQHNAADNQQTLGGVAGRGTV
jgi:hypothetical protein